MTEKERVVKSFEKGVMTAHEAGVTLVDLMVEDYSNLPPEIVEAIRNYQANLIEAERTGKKLRTFSITA